MGDYQVRFCEKDVARKKVANPYSLLILETIFCSTFSQV